MWWQLKLKHTRFPNGQYSSYWNAVFLQTVCNEENGQLIIVLNLLVYVYHSVISIFYFRWLTFTLTVLQHDAWAFLICHLGHFFLEFVIVFLHKGHNLGPLLVIFEVCHFMTISGPFLEK